MTARVGQRGSKHNGWVLKWIKRTALKAVRRETVRGFKSHSILSFHLYVTPCIDSEGFYESGQGNTFLKGRDELPVSASAGTIALVAKTKLPT